jgi:hypothetical protein
MIYKKKEHSFSTSEKLDPHLNDSATTTNMEPAPPIKDPSIKDPTYQELEPHLNDSTTTTNMEPEPLIKDPSIKDPTYHERIVIGYTVDQQGQNIRDKDIVRPDNHKWARNGSGETHEWKKKARAGVLCMEPVRYAGRQDLPARSAHAHTETI